MWTTIRKKPVAPSAPQLSQLELSQGVYGSEQGCDVIFLVGQEDQPWRIPAHKSILQNSTPVFKAMFSENFGQEGDHSHQIVNVIDVDGRAFDNLLRHLYALDVEFQSVETALRTLYAAHKYECPELVKKCVDYLDQVVNVNNILQILNHVSLYCGNIQNLENCGRERQMMQDVLSCDSATGEISVDHSDTINSQNFSQMDASDCLDSIETECARLLYNCLCFVDKEANAVLKLDEMEDLDSETFALILSRDTLDVEDENLVFNAVLKWTDKECKRQQRPLTIESKRNVLGPSLYLPRYLIMSLQSFTSQSGPAKSGLLTDQEVDVLMRIIKAGIQSTLLDASPQNTFLGIPPSLGPFYRKIARPRCPIRLNLIEKNASQKSRRGLGFIERWNKRKCCCRKSRRGSSQLPTPVNSNPSSPARNINENKKLDICLERFVIFLACLFD